MCALQYKQHNKCNISSCCNLLHKSVSLDKFNRIYDEHNAMQGNATTQQHATFLSIAHIITYSLGLKEYMTVTVQWNAMRYDAIKLWLIHYISNEDGAIHAQLKDWKVHKKNAILNCH